MSNIGLSQNEIEKWKNEAMAVRSISQVLRKLSVYYKIDKFEIASLSCRYI